MHFFGGGALSLTQQLTTWAYRYTLHLFLVLKRSMLPSLGPIGIVPIGIVPRDIVPRDIVPRGIVPRGIVPRGIVPSQYR